MQFISTEQTQPMRIIHNNSPRYLFVRSLLRASAHLSTGLALGCTYGFDSGLSMDYIYRNEPEGHPFLGKLIDRIYLEHPIHQALRARKILLQEKLLNLVLERRKQGLHTHILDIASGTGRGVIEILRALEGNDVTLTCFDTDEHVLAVGKELAAQYNLSDAVTFMQTDVLNLKPDDIPHPPDIIVVSGWYEHLLDDAAVCRSLITLRSLLSQGGVLLFTTQVRPLKSDTIPSVFVNRYGEPLRIHARPLARVERWAREAGFGVVRSKVEPLRLSGVVTCVV